MQVRVQAESSTFAVGVSHLGRGCADEKEVTQKRPFIFGSLFVTLCMHITGFFFRIFLFPLCFFVLSSYMGWWLFFFFWKS